MIVTKSTHEYSNGGHTRTHTHMDSVCKIFTQDVIFASLESAMSWIFSDAFFCNCHCIVHIVSYAVPP